MKLCCASNAGIKIVKIAEKTQLSPKKFNEIVISSPKMQLFRKK